MDTKNYTQEDCISNEHGLSLKGTVVVLDNQSRRAGGSKQLYYCTGGDGAETEPTGCSVFLISLSTGEYCRGIREDVVGILKPELLSDSAKLQLSQIRPVGAMDVNEHMPKYSGYSFLPDGRMQQNQDQNQNGNGNQMQILKNCRIWQLKPETDIMKRFISFDHLQKKYGIPNSKDYQNVFDGPVTSNNLEELYDIFHESYPPSYTGHLLSISDIVELYDEVGSEFYYCDQVGFRACTFHRSEKPFFLNCSNTI